MNRSSRLLPRIVALAITIAALPPARATTIDPAPLPPLPSPDQLAWQSAPYALYVRFDLATFTGESRDARQFNPAALNPRLWVQTARELGFQRLVLSANDANGFCLWPTRTTRDSVANTPWRGGGGDVVRDFVDACRDARMPVGLSVSGYARGNAVSDAELMMKIRELLTGYGPIAELRLDGAGGEGTTSTPSLPPTTPRPHRDWAAVFAVIRELQPHTIIVSNIGPDARWNGNNIGHAGEPQWSTISPDALPGPELTDKSQLKLLNMGDPNGTRWIPAECFIPLRPNWTWREGDEAKLIAPDRLFTAYAKATGKNCDLLINIPLDPTGALPAPDVARLRELHATATAAFAHNLAAGARASASHTRGDDARFAAANVVDHRPDTYWATDDAVTGGCWLELDLGAPTTFDAVELAEPISLGQRVATYRIEVPEGSGWKAIVPGGKSIGRHKVERFAPVTAAKVRLLIEQSRACPLISEFAVYALQAKGSASVSAPASSLR